MRMDWKQLQDHKKQGAHLDMACSPHNQEKPVTKNEEEESQIMHQTHCSQILVMEAHFERYQMPHVILPIIGGEYK